jgi:ParB/RepB/Spo0J family partition protein
MTIRELSLEALDLRYAGLRVRRPMAEKRLMASLGERGQQSPVVVVAGSEAGRWVVIDGHKRVRALSRLKADVVKAAVWEMPAVDALVAAYQGACGSGWNAIEEGALVWELVREAGLSESEAGRRLERSKGWVSGRLGLVESLPEAVMEGVRSGKIGAYTATRHLLPFARANALDCENLAAKIMESGFCSREVEALCRYYGTAGREGRRRMLEDPARFLKALVSTRRQDAGPLGVEEARCLKNLDLIGNVSLSLARNLPGVAGSDTGQGARERLKPAWERARRRWDELSKTAAAVFMTLTPRPAFHGGADRGHGEDPAHAG